MFFTLVSVVTVTALVLVVILSRVDDWGRDFSTNVATTSENGKLKPLHLSLSVNEATDKLRSVVADMPHWQWTKDTKSEDGSVIVDLVRSTALFRFKDDIQVKIVDDEAKNSVVINAVSRSRVGKGDLGQNPRNIRELFESLGMQ